jgi:hypothetical protein
MWTRKKLSMKLWIKTLFKDLLAIGLLLSLFYFAGKEYLSLISGKIQGSGEPIGVVSDLAYYPKRQLTGDEYTYNLEGDDDLYEGDLITSDSFSSINMNLIDGTEIALEHGSSLVLHLAEDTIYFTGTISALSTEERESPLKLINMNEVNPKPIVLSRGTQISLSTDEKGMFNMSVLDGEVTRGTDTIKENEQFTLTQAGETAVSKLSFVLNNPPNNSHWVTFEETQTIRFSWFEPEPHRTRSLWISRDRDFENIIYQRDNLNQLSWEVALEPGDYFWRVGDGTKEEYSSPDKLKIAKNLPLRGLTPARGTEITYREQTPKQTFMWQGAEDADSWELEIGTTNDLSRTVFSEKTLYNQIQVNDLEEGEYWWRVSAGYEGFENVTTVNSGEAEKLIITRLNEVIPPRLIAPEKEEELSPLEFSEGIRFSWRGDPEIGLHRFTFSPSPDMSDPIFTENTRSTYIIVKEKLLPGDYYWQIFPLLDGEVTLEGSEIRSLICTEKEHRLEQIYPAPEEGIILSEGNNLVFRWDSTEKGHYRFRLWKISGDEEKLVNNTISNREEISQYIGEKGDYLWQVDLIDENNRVVLEGSKKPFTVARPLLAPYLAYPLPGSQISLIGDATLPLSWTGGTGDSYSGKLYQTGTEEAVLSFTNIIENSLEADIDLLKEGDYTMELQAGRTDEGKGLPTMSPVSSSMFTIEEIVIFKAPQILYPPEGTVTNRLDLLRDGVNISWESAYSFPNYEVLLKQKSSGTLLMRRVTNQQAFLINDIYPDEYLIEVSGIDKRGQTSPSGITDLTVQAVEPLLPVEMVSPVKGETIDMSDRDTLLFRWQQREEGEKYNIALYGIRGDVIFSLDNYEKTFFEFSDLSKLDLGDFIFAVEAVKDYNTIGIVRKSPETRAPFTITIKTVEVAPVILSPDVQYAD